MASVFEFGEFRLDCARVELLRDGQPVNIERKPMELLVLLAERGGELVTREEIAARLWGSEVFVDTEHGINTAIRKIRQALREGPQDSRFLITLSGRGYRLEAKAVSASRPPASAVPDSASPMAPAVPPAKIRFGTHAILGAAKAPTPSTDAAVQPFGWRCASFSPLWSCSSFVVLAPTLYSKAGPPRSIRSPSSRSKIFPAIRPRITPPPDSPTSSPPCSPRLPIFASSRAPPRFNSKARVLRSTKSQANSEWTRFSRAPYRKPAILST